ncbi:Baeyer-Villiger monooxygenase [Aspergillus unguis]
MVTNSQDSNPVDYDAIVVGAGFGGLCMLHELRKQGMAAKLIDAAGDVGGTWYWNRYPGARTDSESWSYIVNFSPEVKQEWNWTERFSLQGEVHEYLRHVADRFDMRKEIQFGTRVESAHYQDRENHWAIRTDRGDAYTCRFFITAAGVLSAGRRPPFPGIDSFQGDWYVTSEWPKEKIDFTGKRVAVIGTGATGVQIIPTLAHVAKSEHRTEIKRNYEAIWEQAQSQVFGFAMPIVGRTLPDVTDPAQQRKILEAGWEAGGFRFVFGTFDDLLTNPQANELASAFVREKIRTIVKDPKTAELLCPRYPLLAKRPPLGHFYYEAYNRPNVHLVDVSTYGIEEITPKGLRLGNGDEYEFDVIIYAIGFDAVTGALTRMDIRGRNGRVLASEFSTRPETFLGIMVDDYPNMFTISGPQSPFANMPVVIDTVVMWIGKALAMMRKRNATRVEVKRSAVDWWCEQVRAAFEASVLATSSAQVHSWYVGANVPGKPANVLFYFGGLVAYIDHCRREAEGGFPNLIF